jgi:hypothetical protein
MNSKELSNWLSRYIREDDYIVIYDNYIGSQENIKHFKKYILKHIKNGANIQIYTIESDNIKKKDIIKAFEDSFYNSWNIEVYLVASKKDNHPRMIVTQKYNISLERGVSAFGELGECYQTVLDIVNNDDGTRYINKDVAKKIV